jgi:hypothetical protein
MPGRITPGYGSYDRDPVTPEELEWLKAIDRYKHEENRPFLTWREVLAIALSLGYRKVAEPTALPKLSDFEPPHYERQQCNIDPKIVAARHRWRKKHED